MHVPSHFRPIGSSALSLVQGYLAEHWQDRGWWHSSQIPAVMEDRAWCKSCTQSVTGPLRVVRGSDISAWEDDECGESSALATTSTCCSSYTTCSVRSAPRETPLPASPPDHGCVTPE